MSKIVVVGCGNMGSNLVRAFMEGGHSVSIVDLREEAAKPFVEKGASYHKSLAEAGDADLIVLNLINIDIVKSVIDSVDTDYLKGKLILNTTTAIPADALEMANLLKEKGAEVIDAKILCYPPEVGTEASFMVFCGEKCVYEKMETMITAICMNPWYLGESLTNAAVLDNAGTEVQCAVRYAMCEAVKLAFNNNADIEPLFTVFAQAIPGVIDANIRQIKKNFSNGYETNSFPPAEEVSIDVTHKGLSVLQTSFARSGIDSAFNRAMLEKYQKAIETGLGGNEDCAVITVI